MGVGLPLIARASWSMDAQYELAHTVIPFSYIGTARPGLCSGAVSYRKAALRHEGLRAPLYMRRNGRRQHGGARADPLERRRRIRNHAACRRFDDWRDGAFDGSDACRHPSIYMLIKPFGPPRDDETAWLSKTLAIRSAFQSAD